MHPAGSPDWTSCTRLSVEGAGGAGVGVAAASVAVGAIVGVAGSGALVAVAGTGDAVGCGGTTVHAASASAKVNSSAGIR